MPTTPCEVCTPTLPIATCSDTLEIGQTAYASTLVYIFFKNLNLGPDGSTERQSATTNADGVVSADMSEPSKGFYNDVHKFELWVSLQDTAQGERLPIFIAGSEFTCFAVTFEIINEADPVTYANVILQLDEEFTAVTPLFEYDGTKGVVREFGGTTVKVWEDQSGNGRDAIQNTFARQPTDGTNVITFGGNDILEVADFTYDQDFLYIMVLARNTGSNAPPDDFIDIITQYDRQSGADQAWALYVDTSLSDIYMDFLTGAGLTIKARSIEGLTILNNNILIEGIFDNGEADLLANRIRQPLSSYQDDTMTTFANSSADIIIGGLTDGGGFDEEWIGNIGGVVAWNDRPPATQIQQTQLEMLGRV